MTKQQRDMILAFAESGMRYTKAAKKVFYNRETLRYHFRMIRRETGLDAGVFKDLVKLVEMAEREG